MILENTGFPLLIHSAYPLKAENIFCNRESGIRDLAVYGLNSLEDGALNWNMHSLKRAQPLYRSIY